MKKAESVSRVAENRRESDHESNRKQSSTVAQIKSKSSDHFPRADQHASVKSASPQGPNESPVVQDEPGREQSGAAKSVVERRRESEENFRKLRKVTSSNK